MAPLCLPLLQQQLLLLWLIAVSSSSFSSYSAPMSIAKPNCKDECGNVKIPYPFGMGPPNCYNNSFYEVDCRNSSNSVYHHPAPFLKRYNLEILDIVGPTSFNSYEDTKQLITVIIPPKNVCASDDGAVVDSVSFEGSPYSYSDGNEFIVMGCGGSAVFMDNHSSILGGCSSLCAPDSSATTKKEVSSCVGMGCCRSSGISDGGFSSYRMTTTTKFDKCTLTAGVITKKGFGQIEMMSFPAELKWTVANFTADFMLGDNDTYHCDYYSDWLSKSCHCAFYHEGNPYIRNGCQVVHECQKCRKHCHYNFDYSELRYYCVNPLLQPGPILGFSISIGSVLLLLSCYWLYRFIRRKLEAKRKAKYFKRNGGLLLQQHMVSGDGSFDRTKVFRVTELEKATNNFNKDRILGKGGQGTVYKGMLTDGKIVAIKKSNLVDEGQLDHFINELVILCQINHRNVVKLLGCCLETEVPLLVYEFIPNGTLYHLLHASPSEDFHLTWKMRLLIASESANALWYLHSSSATPIYHRDIKSSNILLDEKYRATVSDFGTSRTITIEQTHVTTCVMGTYGYLDPEYFQSNQFTEKSDVYSFGVVLVELITGKKPICPTKSGGWISLAYEFLFHMETSRLFDMLDARVLEEGSKEELIAVAKLARQCLHMSGKLRPSMKEIAEVLDGIRTQKLPVSKEGNCGEIKDVVNEMGDIQSASFRANTFSLGTSAVAAFSIDVQQPIPNTF